MRSEGGLLLLGGLAVLGGATGGMLAGVEPFATWYYPWAWYGTLAAAEGTLRLRSGRWYLLARPGAALGAFAWSVPFWLTFELLNFRIRNWYYVFVPDTAFARYAGITISFATVIPAVLVAQKILERWGVFDDVRTPGWRVPDRVPGLLQGLAVAMIGVALAWPRWFFPFVWGALTLLADPLVYRRAPRRSLLGALAGGRPALPLRLLAGGLAIGLVWELFNARARGKWIYTVPGLEEVKLFEMPLAGFLGFPVLALDAWVLWQALILLGLARPPGEVGTRPGEEAWVPPPASRRVRLTVAVVALVGSAAILKGMEERTITSYTPRLGELTETHAPVLQAAGYDVFSLARAEPIEVAARANVRAPLARSWIETARVASLRGIGVVHASALRKVGIRTVEELARADPGELARRLDHLVTVTPARVRVWVRAAAAGG